jgi:hypothetical protein
MFDLKMKVKRDMVIAMMAVFFCAGIHTHAAEHTDIDDTGQYIFKPRRRFDIRQQNRQLSSDTHLHITTFRFDLPTPLNEGEDGVFSPRIDIPLVASDFMGNDNPNGDTYDYGGGDLLTQFAYIYPEDSFSEIGLDGFALGAQMRWPIAGKSFSGSEKYQVAPLVAAKWNLPEVSNGSFVAPIFRHFLSYADHNEGGERRDDINEFSIQPYL